MVLLATHITRMTPWFVSGADKLLILFVRIINQFYYYNKPKYKIYQNLNSYRYHKIEVTWLVLGLCGEEMCDVVIELSLLLASQHKQF